MSPEMQRSFYLDWCDERSICPDCRESLADCWCPEPDTDDTEPDTLESP